MRVAYTLRPEDLTPDFLNGLAALFNSQTQTLNVVVETNDATFATDYLKTLQQKTPKEKNLLEFAANRLKENPTFHLSEIVGQWPGNESYEDLMQQLNQK